MSGKRTRDTNALDTSASEKNPDFSDDADDISFALTGKKRKLSKQPENLVDDDPEDFSRFIQESIAKREVKEGARVVKGIKGKQSLKGEVGGGSFQSMGTVR